MAQLNKLVVFSGHMIDRPNRPTPRFPPSKENIVAKHILNQLQSWNMGTKDLAIVSGACGGDILFAEACLKLGMTVWLYLALPETEFIERSVRIENTDWEERYQKLSQNEKTSKEYLDNYQGKLTKNISVFAQTNLWIINTAIQLASKGNLYALLIWDEKPTGDGPGGTSDFVNRIQSRCGNIAIINPTKL